LRVTILRCCAGLGSLNDGVETGRIINRDFAEQLSIQGDASLLAAVDKLTVPDASLPAGSA